MAHLVTRIEGFEGGTLTASINGQGGTAPTIVTSPVRTGAKALRINAASGASSFALIHNRFTGAAEQDTVDIAAAIFRGYFRLASLPAADTPIFAFLNAATTAHMIVEYDSATGALQLGTAQGTTVLVPATWYRLECKYVNGVSREVRLNGTTEITDATTAGGVLISRLGRSTTPATALDIAWDDIVIETDATQANIDWPGFGVVRKLELVGDGTDDGTWISTTDPNAYQSCDGDENGDTDLIEAVTGSSKDQTFTIQTAEQAGLELAPLACQETVVVRREAAVACLYRVRLRSSTTINETTDATPSTAYRMQLKVYNTDPHTGGAWTRTSASSVQPGVHYTNSTGDLRCTSVIWQVAEPFPDSSSSGVVLEQFELVTGALRSTTEFVPQIRTVGITSEAFGRVNEAFNVVAANIRYVPTGLDVWSGHWRFDNHTTVPFTLPANPYSFDYTSTNASSFLYQHSGEEVYTHRVPIDGTGKVFEIALSRAGKQPWEILAMDLEITTEGRRAAYLDDGEF